MAKFRLIPLPWKNWDSWTLLIGVFGLWAFTRLLVPGPDGARLPGIWLPSCPFRSIAGIPCPFCGITTGSAWMAHGNIVEAWRSNILSPLLMLSSLGIGAYVLFFRMIAGREFIFVQNARRRLWLAAATLIAASWIVNLLK